MGIVERFGFHNKCKLEKSKFSQEDVIKFHRMLLKMKKRRPNLNVKRIMGKLYPNFRIEDSIQKNIL